MTHHDVIVDDRRREARDMVATLVRASAVARATAPKRRWYDRIMGNERIPLEAMLVMTAAGEAGAYMTERGDCLLRCRGDSAVNRYLRTLAPGRLRWDGDERAWTVPGDALEDALTEIVSAREVDGHSAPSPSVDEDAERSGDEPVTPVVVNSRYGMMTGQQQGGMVEIMVLDGRMQDELRSSAVVGTYRQEHLIGLWAVQAAEFADAVAWAA